LDLGAYATSPDELPAAVRNDREVRAWQQTQANRVGRFNELRDRLRKIHDALSAGGQAFPRSTDPALDHGYFLNREPRQSPIVFSLIVTRNAATGTLELHSATVVRGKPKDGKAGNVRITLLPESESPNTGTMEVRAHRKAAESWIEDPDVSLDPLYCSRRVRQNFYPQPE